MNISQHLFLPLVQRESRRGYYGNTGQFNSSPNFVTYPLMDYPNGSVCNICMLYNREASTKLRTWPDITPSAAGQIAYTMYGLNDTMNPFALWTSADKRSNTSGLVKVLLWKERWKRPVLGMVSFDDSNDLNDVEDEQV